MRFPGAMKFRVLRGLLVLDRSSKRRDCVGDKCHQDGAGQGGVGPGQAPFSGVHCGPVAG